MPTRKSKKKAKRFSVFIFGAGKVGRALASALKREGSADVILTPARSGFKWPISADLLILAVRDRELGEAAKTLIARSLITKKTAVVHAAGALDSSVLAELRPFCAGVAQMHPMISFASTKKFPPLAKGNVHVEGDFIAVTRARKIAKLLGMTPRTIPHLDTIAYHAAAGLVANGAAALAAVASDILVSAGVPKKTAFEMIGPLLASVAQNVVSLGFPDALTGPVRRGDAAAVDRAYQLLLARVPDAAPLFAVAVAAQIPIAESLAEAPPAAFTALREWAARVNHR